MVQEFVRELIKRYSFIPLATERVLAYLPKELQKTPPNKVAQSIAENRDVIRFLATTPVFDEKLFRVAFKLHWRKAKSLLATLAYAGYVMADIMKVKCKLFDIECDEPIVYRITPLPIALMLTSEKEAVINAIFVAYTEITKTFIIRQYCISPYEVMLNGWYRLVETLRSAGVRDIDKLRIIQGLLQTYSTYVAFYLHYYGIRPLDIVEALATQDFSSPSLFT